MPQLFQTFVYRAVKVPTPEEINREGGEAILAAFVNQISVMSSEGQAIQILTFPGFILLGQVAGWIGMEPNIIPAMLPASAPSRKKDH